MRVISGTARGHRLKAPRRMRLRPTPSRVKEALFSSFAARIAGARVLELFAGTGAFGIECLSRGAAEAVFVEKDGRAAALIEDNLKKTKLSNRALLWRVDVRQALAGLQREQKTFNLVFADPPYEKTLQKTGEGPGWVKDLLESSALHFLLAPEGVLLVEHFKKDTKLDSPHFSLSRQFRFGDTMVSVFHHRTP